MKRLKAITATLLVFSVLVMPLSTTVRAAQRGGSITTLVSGTTANGVFSGTLNITKFIVQNGQLAAVGTLTGDVTNSTGTVVSTITGQAVTWPIQSLQATCDILTLVLGPLHLDLLGLVIDLNQVVLTITAQQGSGNLLGNLLCAIAGLLDNPAPGGALLRAIAALLNQILGAL